MSKRYQLVWWQWGDWYFRPWPEPWTGSMALIYEWSISLGPLEIRKWIPTDSTGPPRRAAPDS